MADVILLVVALLFVFAPSSIESRSQDGVRLPKAFDDTILAEDVFLKDFEIYQNEDYF